MKRSIRTQMMLFFSLLVMLPAMGSIVYVYTVLQNHLEQSYIGHQTQTVQTLSQEIGKWRQSYEDVSFNIIADPRTQLFLQSPDWLPIAEQLDLKSEFRKALQVHSSSGNPKVTVYVIKGRTAIFSDTYGDTPPPALSAYLLGKLNQAEAHEGAPVWDHSLAPDKIVLFRAIHDNQVDLNREIGFVFLVINVSDLASVFRQYTLDEGQQFMVYDKAGDFAVATDPEADPTLFRGLEQSGADYGTFTTGPEREMYFAAADRDWRLYTWIPEQKVLLPIREMLLAIILVTAGLLSVSIVMVLYLTHRITKPLKLMQRKMKQIGSGMLDLNVPVLRDDEIGQVASALNRMSEEIARLIQKNREEEARGRLIQLRTLEYQINPHFLYNTLDSVNMLARKNNDPVVADIVTYLSRLFRIGLNQGRELVTVEDEVNHVTYYLKIQEIRFARTLSWEVNLDEKLKPLKIIKFLLQPLAENSINHGIRKRNRPGRIQIRVDSDEENIFLSVKDDGVGMSTEQLERVRIALEEDGPQEEERAGGFGLRNVHQRIRLHYGPPYGLNIESVQNEGTEVTVRLPKP